MSDELLIRHCSPTLAGLKTASLFSTEFRCEKELRERIRNLNKRLSKKGLRVLPLKVSNNRALIYVYRPCKLKQDFENSHTGQLLCDRGYEQRHPERSIAILAGKIRGADSFPHEIGLFLGYPPSDVQGFIDNGAKDCKCRGYWKVYSDVDAAQNLFAKFKKCTDIYTRKLTDGFSIERLTVKC